MKELRYFHVSRTTSELSLCSSSTTTTAVGVGDSVYILLAGYTGGGRINLSAQFEMQHAFGKFLA